jgi:CRISPR-associated protein Cas2
MVHSKYKAMWLVAMFDLPTKSREARRRYSKFRKHLLEEGFQMLQYSVYARYCANEESAETFRRRIRKKLPTSGEVRLIAITDHQFGKMEVYLGKTKSNVETAPSQLLLF